MTTKLQQYLDFLRNKVQLSTGGGLTAVPMHPSLFPHQKDIVAWALHLADLCASRPAKTHEKTKTCPDCGHMWVGNGRRVARCETCFAEKNRIFKKAYKDRKRADSKSNRL